MGVRRPSLGLNPDTFVGRQIGEAYADLLSLVENLDQILAVEDTLTQIAAYTTATQASAGAAATSETNADASATAALASQLAAAIQATNAADSADLAQEWAQNPAGTAVTGYPGQYSALHHASAAQTSATAAAGSATTAGTHAANALASENNADASATAAAASAQDAADEAYNAGSYADAAGVSANAASVSVTLADNYASAADTSANAAATESTNASNSAAAALASQNAAAASEASVATTASDAATSEANAAASATTANTAASGALSSETAASQSAADALSAQVAVEALFDTFDDRFLGTFAVAPTLDNDGNPLAVGACYYDSVLLDLQFWNGTVWEEAVGQALTYANAAATSAADAASSEANAATSEFNAGESETAAATSESNAAASAASASTSASNAATSEANALTYLNQFTGTYTAADVLAKILTVDGAGSGLDAGLLEGLAAAQFLRSDQDTTLTGVLTTTGGLKYTHAINLASSTDLNTVTEAGFYDGVTLTNAPNGDTGWWYITVLRHTNNNGYVLQTARDMNSQDHTIWERKQVGGTWGSWTKLLSSSNGGAGSTFDADKLDGLESTQFLRSDTAVSLNGDLTLTSANPMIRWLPTGANDAAGIRFNYTANDGVMEFWTSDDYSEPFVFNAYDVGLTGTGTKQEWAKIDGSGIYEGGTLLSAKYSQITHDHNLGDLAAETLRDAHGTGVYSFNANSQSLGDSTPSTYWSVLGFGQGAGGMAELAVSWVNGNDLYFRSLRDVTDNWKPWKKIWHENNDGAGSTLDADTVDGLEASQFLRSDTSDTFTGKLTTASQNNGIVFTYVSNASTPAFDTSAASITGGADYGGLGKRNNIDVQTWFGFSVSPTYGSGTVPQGSPAFSVDARTGHIYSYSNVYAGGNVYEAGTALSSKYARLANDNYFSGNTIWNNDKGIYLRNVDNTINRLTLKMNTSEEIVFGHASHPLRISSDGVHTLNGNALVTVGVDTGRLLMSDTFDINGSGPSAQQDGIYAADLGGTVGTTSNPTFTAALCGQVNGGRSIALSVDSNGYVWGFRSHTNAGTYTFQSKAKWADDAGTLDGIDSASFLRSDAADVKTSGTLTFNDNVVAAFGNSNDFELFCNGTDAFMDLNSSGVTSLIVRDGTTNRFTFTRSSGNFTATGNIYGTALHESGTSLSSKYQAILTGVGGLEMNSSGSGDRNCYIDMHSDDTNTDYSTRIYRRPGVNGGLDVVNKGSGNIWLDANGGGGVLFATGGTTRARVDSNGNYLHNTASTSSVFLSSGGTSVGHELWYGGLVGHGRDDDVVMYLNRQTSNGVIVSIRKDGTQVGNITVTASATSYNTSSDYRLKENVVLLTGAIDRLKLLPVHRFNFIVEPGNMVDGFLAHEAAAVVPEAVTGEKDALDAQGNPDYQSIDQSKLVPLLTAALQEAITRIEALEALHAA